MKSTTTIFAGVQTSSNNGKNGKKTYGKIDRLSTRLVATVPAEMIKRVKVMAAINGTTMSKLVEDAIYAFYY